MGDIEIQLFIYAIIIMSAIFHEYAHAWTAYYLGDPTAKNMGRLTLNPLAHIDPFGTVILPLFLMFTGGMFIGYAKPVPVNHFNLNDQENGFLKVALAGPFSNFLIAIVFSIVLRAVTLSGFWSYAIELIIYVNILLGLFNLIPVPPLDGSKVLKKFTSIDLSFGGSFIGVLIALMIAFSILPSLASFFFGVLTGTSF